MYFLAEQMGTSIHMIESHYGHAKHHLNNPTVYYKVSGMGVAAAGRYKAKASKAAGTHDPTKKVSATSCADCTLPKRL
jgi:hypothetical protein